MSKTLPLVFLCTLLFFALDAQWSEYYQNTLDDSTPRETLTLACQYFENEGKTSGTAVDLGAGTGRDSLYLIRNGWHVLAIDAEPLSIDIILKRSEDEQLNSPDVMVSSYSEMILPSDIDLINASFSLPFCAPEEFSSCWQKITDHLAVGGRFAGQMKHWHIFHIVAKKVS